MKTVIEMALSVVPEDDREDAHGYELLRLTYSEIERFAELVRADAIAEEREACAKQINELEKQVKDWQDRYMMQMNSSPSTGRDRDGNRLW